MVAKVEKIIEDSLTSLFIMLVKVTDWCWLMVDYDVQTVGDFQGFCSRVKMLLPDFQYLPDAKELSRMEVQSFAKPVAMWTENNAPVVGSRFQEYRRIAMLMANYLSDKVAKN